MMNLSSNRAFLYGDGVFESILIRQGEAPFLAYHLTRLRESLAILDINPPFPLDNTAEIWRHIQSIIQYDTQNSYRVRLSVWRDSTGLYTPNSNQSDFLFQAQIVDIAAQKIFLDKVDICPSVRLAYDSFSALKSLSAGRYVVAARFRQAEGLDDCFLLNTDGRIAEASSSNVFVVTEDNTIYTPALSEACINGVMRRVVLDTLNTLSYKVIEGQIDLNCLAQAKEIFLSNAISGVRTILFYNQRNLDAFIANKLRELF